MIVPENRNDVVRDVFKTVFTAEELAGLEGYHLTITVFMDNVDASFLGAGFRWLPVNNQKSSPYTDVSFGKFRQIEVLLGERLKYKIADEGKNLNFNMDCFNFYGLDKITPVDIPDQPEWKWKQGVEPDVQPGPRCF